MRILNSSSPVTSAALAIGLSLSSGACTGNLIGDGAPGNSTGATSPIPGGGAANNGGSGNVGGAGSTDTPPGIEGIGWTTRYPRLSHAQWENTVRDLLSLDALPGKASAFALDPDSRFDTFSFRTVSANLWLDYQRAAEEVAKDVAHTPAKLARVVTAAAQGSPRAFVTELGPRAFRRPLSEQEIAGHVALFEKAGEFASGDTFANGAELVIRAFLQSPHFLYRVETSTTAKDGKVWLNDYEVAARLSYGLWNTMPSAELFAAAKAGELVTPQGVSKWTQAMLEDVRAKQPLVGFHEQLFNVVNYGTIAKNETLFPTFTEELAPVLREEARRFFEEIVVTRGASVAGLLTTPVTFVNATTAPFYGLSGDSYGNTLTRVELDPTQRAGVLTHIGFLSKYGSQSQSDPILRGVHISLDIICSALPAPPNDIPPLPALLDGQTNRERVEQLTGKQPCAACHETFINALGFGLENYDAIGRWRDVDNGQPVNSSASYTLDGKQVSFTGPIELSRLLAQSPSVHRCYSENWLEYVMGRKPAEEERGVLDQVAAASVQTDSMGSLLASITALETFRARPEEIK